MVVEDQRCCLQIVCHLAASVDFNMRLDRALDINARAGVRMMNLAKSWGYVGCWVRLGGVSWRLVRTHNSCLCSCTFSVCTQRCVVCPRFHMLRQLQPNNAWAGRAQHHALGVHPLNCMSNLCQAIVQEKLYTLHQKPEKVKCMHLVGGLNNTH